jgi:hypothetical protein
MLSSKEREHRMRVLENQERIAARQVKAEKTDPDAPMRIPLIVEAKGSHTLKPRPRRTRTNREAHQSELGEF